MRATPADYDVIVIGCGAAGLAAAVSFCTHALEAGRKPRVAVLERASREQRGGATRWTGSWFRVTEDRRLDPKFCDDMALLSSGCADLQYCRTLERETPATLAFLERHGVAWRYFKQAFANTNTGGGLAAPIGGGAAIVDGLAAVIDRTEGAEILYDAEAIALHTSTEHRVDGVRVRRHGAEQQLAARAVIIACGGFEGDPDLRARYLGEAARDLPLIAPTLCNNRGDGLRMAVEVGAATAGQFDMFHGEPADPRSRRPDAAIYAFPYGIIVNRHARRFFDEGKASADASFEELAVTIWREQEQRAFLIMDRVALAIPGIGQTILTELPPVRADSVGGLAESLGLDPAALIRTVAEYNAAVGSGRFDHTKLDGKATRGLDPPKSNWAMPIEAPPYAAYPLTCAITFTFGGIRTDAEARVLTAAGVPIPGLYAAGEVTGVYYGSYPAGTSVLRALSFGRLAGTNAAALWE